jgi:hypothetical protein
LKTLNGRDHFRDGSINGGRDHFRDGSINGRDHFRDGSIHGSVILKYFLTLRL